MNRAVEQLLAGCTVHLRRGPFVLGAWPVAMESAVHAGVIRGQRKLSLVMRDELEVTALVEESALSEMPPPRQLERGWVVFTLGTVMTWDLIGVLATLTTALAEAGVPVGAVSAFSRDHLLVQAPHVETALEVLSRLCAAVDEAR